MTIDIIKIGTSRGIIIPKFIIDGMKLSDRLTLEIIDDKLILRAPKDPRLGWSEAFAQQAAEGLSAEEREWLDADLDDTLEEVTSADFGFKLVDGKWVSPLGENPVWD